MTRRLVLACLACLALPFAAPPAAAAPPGLVAEAEAFMTAYARELSAGDRAAIAARYSRDGAYTLGSAPIRFQGHDAIVKDYAGPGWEKPAAFAWRDLSYEPVGEEAVIVAGQFDWTLNAGGPAMEFAYTALLRREGRTLRIRLEHENPLPKPH